MWFFSLNALSHLAKKPLITTIFPWSWMTVEHSFSTKRLPECQPVVKCSSAAVRCASCIACLKCNVLSSLLLRARGGTVVLHWRSLCGQLFQRWVTAALLLLWLPGSLRVLRFGITRRCLMHLAVVLGWPVLRLPSVWVSASCSD